MAGVLLAVTTGIKAYDAVMGMGMGVKGGAVSHGEAGAMRGRGAAWLKLAQVQAQPTS
jgi:hypothetical protein